MAEEKKPPVKRSDSFDTVGNFYKNNLGSPLALVAFIVFVTLLFFLAWINHSEEFRNSVIGYLTYHGGPYLSTVKTIFTVTTIIWIAGIIYLFIRTREINSIEYHKYKSIDVKANEQKEHNTQWQTILDYLDADNPAEWRIAILEADVMLDEVVKKAGGFGDTLGERLKSIGPDGFRSIQAAWDAHKIRNLIAHEGADYQLTKREAKRVIDLYGQVFNEFHYI